MNIDKLGICASFFCMLHCLVLPFFLLIGFDTIHRFVDQEWLELTLVMSALFVGLLSFSTGFIKHRQHFIPVLFIAGFLLLVNGETVSQSWISLGLSSAGALTIIYAHSLNLKWKHRVRAR